MAYITPIFDRSQADIINKVDKSFFDSVDWARVYGNSEEVNTLIFNIFSVSLSFNSLPVFDDEYIPTITDLNEMLENIETMRAWMEANYPALVDDPLFVEIKDDWLPGRDSPAPAYTEVNSWEKVLDIMYDGLNFYVTNSFRQPICGIAISGSGLTRQNYFRG